MSEEMTKTTHSENPAWFDGKKINETLFCEEFLRDYPMITVNGAFFTVNGRVHDENRLKKVIYDRIKYYVTSGIAKKVTMAAFFVSTFGAGGHSDLAGIYGILLYSIH